MKYRNLFLVLCCFFCCSATMFSQTISSKDLLGSKWYNEEYSFTFNGDGTYKAFYTFGKTNGIMTGSYTVKSGTRITISLGSISGFFNTAFMTDNAVVVELIRDDNNPKATLFLKTPDDTFVLWNEKSFVPSGKTVRIPPHNSTCVTLGYSLSSTTDNVRIRKGPGTEHEYMTFFYKDATTDTVKSHASVLAGTNIRIVAKTQEKFKVGEWYNNWYYIEYKEPKGELIVYKNAWMFGEFINVPENKNRAVTIDAPVNEEAFYGIYSMEVRGTVTGAPVSMKYQLKNSYGNVIFDQKISNYTQEKGSFSFTLTKENDSLFIGTNIITVIAQYSDGKKASKQITVFVHEGGVEMAKPVIYLYPKEQTTVSVRVTPKNGISVSDPPYGDGWTVTAHPDGSILDSKGKRHTYLFWESSNYTPPEITEGFVVPKNKIANFFREKLRYLGLNKREIEHFIDFWKPILNKKPYYLISFYDQKAIEEMAPLSVSPKPDTIIRVFFDSRPLDEPIKIKEQQLVPAQRSGFSVIEWGGMKY